MTFRLIISMHHKYDDVDLWSWVGHWHYKFYNERLKIIKRGCCCGGTTEARTVHDTVLNHYYRGLEWFGIWRGYLVTETTQIETPCLKRPL